MKIITKLMFLLFITLTAFGLVIVTFLYISQNQQSIVAESNFKNKQLIVERIVKSKTERLEIIRNEYTAWDEMIDYCANPTAEFYENNFAPLNESYGTEFVIVYNKEKDHINSSFKNFTPFNGQNNGEAHIFPSYFNLEKQTIEKLFNNQAFCHFFCMNNGQLLEVIGANVVPSADLIKRETPAQGYVLLGKIWSDEYIKEISEAVGAELTISKNNTIEKATASKEFLTITSLLTDSLGENTAQLNFKFKDDSANELAALSQLSYGLILVAVLVIIFFLYMLRKIIGKPILQISETLDTSNDMALGNLSKSTDEFGKIAQMIHRFFNQQNVLEERNTLLKEQNIEIERQNRSIQSSINYAKRIQEAVLPDLSEVNKVLPMNFVFFKPRDIVSGDFYWSHIMPDRILIAAADCTGHGVPGAFMSILGITQLNDIVKEDPNIKPHEILNRLRVRLKSLLNQSSRESDRKEGLDISLCAIDIAHMKLEFSGAYNSMYLIRKNDTDPNQKYSIIEIKGDRMPVGAYPKEKESFTLNTFDLQKGDAVYLSSDGISDQFGGEKGRKFNWLQLKELLLDLQEEPFEIQINYIEKAYFKWKGENKQVDDILVVGFKIL